MNTYCSYFGLTSTTLDIRYPQGKPRRNSGWAEETSLDVEWTPAIAPGAKIMLVVAANSSLNNLLGAMDYPVANGATVASMSWGAGEIAGETSDDSHFNQPGVTFAVSSGDSGDAEEGAPVVEARRLHPHIAINVARIAFASGLFLLLHLRRDPAMRDTAH